MKSEARGGKAKNNETADACPELDEGNADERGYDQPPTALAIESTEKMRGHGGVTARVVGGGVIRIADAVTYKKFPATRAGNRKTDPSAYLMPRIFSALANVSRAS